MVSNEIINKHEGNSRSLYDAHKHELPLSIWFGIEMISSSTVFFKNGVFVKAIYFFRIE